MEYRRKKTVIYISEQRREYSFYAQRYTEQQMCLLSGSKKVNQDDHQYSATHLDPQVDPKCSGITYNSLEALIRHLEVRELFDRFDDGHYFKF